MKHAFIAVALVVSFAFSVAAAAADMTFQVVNDTERSLNMKLFSRADTHQQWPSRTKAYTVRPDSAVQQLKISCTQGEQICWGAWNTVQSVSGEVGEGGQRATRVSTFNVGAGERGIRTCSNCCHVCTDGAMVPAVTMSNSTAVATAR